MAQPSNVPLAEYKPKHRLLQDPNKLWFEPKELAQILDSGTDFIYKRLDTGEIEHARQGRKYKIPRYEAIRLERALWDQLGGATS